MRAVVKAAIQGVFGRLPGGPHLYRELTRGAMGTQASHIDKMKRAWPGYAETWTRYGIELDGKEIWMHEGAWTIYPFLLIYLLTGRGGTVTMWEGALQDKYSAKALEYAARQEFGSLKIPPERVETIKSLVGLSAQAVVGRLDGKWLLTDRVRPALESGSVDLLVTGGVLEHFKQDELDAFLCHARGILRPGAWASHVFDMRDHLYHADKSIPFLNHLRYSKAAYGFLYGHRLGFHNRLLPAELKAKIEQAGFEVIAMRRRVLPAEKYVESPADFENALVGLPREKLAPLFQAATDEDLRTVAVQFICKRR